MTDPLGRVTLADCPPGPFLYEGELGFKTEYRAMVQAPWTNPAPTEPHYLTSRWPDAYCMATGEAFWGGTTCHRDRAALLVLPIVLSGDAVRSARVGVMLYRGPGTICPTCFGASWVVGRRTAQCGGCGTPLDLATPQAAEVYA